MRPIGRRPAGVVASSFYPPHVRGMAHPLAMFDALLDPSDPDGSYLLAETTGWRMLLRLTGDEPDDATIAPAPHWHWRLPDPA
jgi:hypothetical protein